MAYEIPFTLLWPYKEQPTVEQVKVLALLAANVRFVANVLTNTDRHVSLTAEINVDGETRCLAHLLCENCSEMGSAIPLLVKNAYSLLTSMQRRGQI